MYNRAQKVAQELRKARATGELSCAITTRQTTLHRCCAVPVKLAEMSSVTTHQERISKWVYVRKPDEQITVYPIFYTI